MGDKPSYSQLEKRIDELEDHTNKLELKFAELHQRLAVVLKDSNDAIIVHDFDGNITLWNKGAEKMYGWSEPQALDMNISEIVPPQKTEEDLEFIKDVAHGESVSSFETKRITADGRILDVLLTATALVNEDGFPISLALTERDITKQKQSPKERRELIKELQKTNAKLQKTLAETKTLRGIIPICMLCKQIRNDKGYWQQVEVYVHNHTEADFSHGICPNCLQEKLAKKYKKRLLLSAPKLR